MGKTFIMSFYKSSRWCKVLLLIIIILLFFIGVNTYSNKEGFINQTEKFSFIKGPQIFDGFYSNIYDDIITDTVKDEYQVGEIINNTSPTNSSLVLDVGSGTGDVVSLFNQKNVKAIGLDNSFDMIKIAKSKYPTLTFNHGNASNIMIYPAHTFTHITCLNDTIYYIKDKTTFIKNVYEWLLPGGFFILGLNKSDDFALTNNNKHNFTTFTYKSSFEKNKTLGYFTEMFKDDNNIVRKQQHELYLLSNKKILEIAQNNGFIIEREFSLSPIHYNNKSVYLLYKPE